MIDRRFAGLLGIAVVVLLVHFAPSARAGGIFSAMYFGESVYSLSARAQGMGGAGIGVTDGAPDPVNPASLTRSPLTCFGVIYRPQICWAEDGKTTQRLVSGRLSSAVFSLPLGKGIYMGAGVEQIHSVLYRSSQSDSTEEGYAYTRSFSRSGGIFGGGLSAAYSPLPQVSLGIGYHWLFGGISEVTKLDFDISSFTDTEDELTETHSGGYFTTGIMCKTEGMGVGIYYRPKIDGHGSYELRTAHGIETSEDYDFVLPKRVGVGLSLGPFSGLLMAVDVWHEGWKSARFGTTGAEFKDCTAFNLGLEYEHVREGKRPMPPLRLGYRYRPGYYAVKIEDGTLSPSAPTDEAVSIGTSLSTGGGRGTLDIALLAGRRGGLLLHGAKERYLELNFGFVGFERWARRKFPG